MDAGVAASTLRTAPDGSRLESVFHRAVSAAGKVLSALRVTAARGHLRRHRSTQTARLPGATMLRHRRRRASLHLTPRRSALDHRRQALGSRERRVLAAFTHPTPFFSSLLGRRTPARRARRGLPGRTHDEGVGRAVDLGVRPVAADPGRQPERRDDAGKGACGDEGARRAASAARAGEDREAGGDHRRRQSLER